MTPVSSPLRHEPAAARPSQNRPGLLPAVLSAGFIALTLLPGCGDDDADRALSQASANLASLTGGSDLHPSLEYRTRVYEAILSSASAISQSGTPAQRAAAALLAAEAQMGLAEIPAARAVDLEHRFNGLVVLARARLGQWLNLQASASALDQFDPSAEMADLDALAARRAEEMAQAQSRRDELDRRIKELTRRADERNQHAQAERLRGAEIRRQEAEVSATRGAELAVEVRKHMRAADLLQVEAAKLMAQVEVIRPQLAAAELEIQKLSRQREQVFAAKAQIKQKAQRKAEQAVQAREQAQDAAQELRSLFEQIRDLRASEIAQAVNEAVSGAGGSGGGFQGAARSARAAQEVLSATARLAAGRASHSLGDVNLTLAHGWRQWAELLEDMAGANPPLPDASTYAEAASAARQAKDEGLQSAIGALKQAQQSFERSGVRGESRERIGRVAQSIGATIAELSGEPADQPDEPPAPPEDQSAPDGAG